MAVIQAIFAACYTEDICISYVVTQAFVAVHIFFLFFVVTLI